LATSYLQRWRRPTDCAVASCWPAPRRLRAAPYPAPVGKRATLAENSTERRASPYRCTHAPSNKLPRRRGSSAATHSESARLGRPRRSDARRGEGRRRTEGMAEGRRGAWCGRRGTAEGTCRRPAAEGKRRDLGQLGFVVGQRFSGSTAWNRKRMGSWCWGGGRRRESSPEPVGDGGGANGVVRRGTWCRCGGEALNFVLLFPGQSSRNEILGLKINSPWRACQILFGACFTRVNNCVRIVRLYTLPINGCIYGS
jgi:hypothetical protein